MADIFYKAAYHTLAGTREICEAFGLYGMSVKISDRIYSIIMAWNRSLERRMEHDGEGTKRI